MWFWSFGVYIKTEPQKLWAVVFEGNKTNRAAHQEWAAGGQCMQHNFLWFFSSVENLFFLVLVMPYEVWTAKKTREK